MSVLFQGVEYLIHWKGYSTFSAPWESEDNGVCGDRCAPRRLELWLSTVSPCTTAPAGDTMIAEVTKDSDSSLDGGGNVRDEFFFLTPVIASCL